MIAFDFHYSCCHDSETFWWFYNFRVQYKFYLHTERICREEAICSWNIKKKTTQDVDDTNTMII